MNTYKIVSEKQTLIVVAKNTKQAEQMAQDFYKVSGKAHLIKEDVVYQSGKIPGASIRPAVKY